jgi:predicted translin family RNA/ssDNA-binding protein
MRNRLTESDLTRIVKRVMNEEDGGDLNRMVNESPQSLDGVKDDLRHVSQKLMRSMDEYTTLMRKGDYKRMSDELDNIRRMVRRLKDVTQQIESKI